MTDIKEIMKQAIEQGLVKVTEFDASYQSYYESPKGTQMDSRTVYRSNYRFETPAGENITLEGEPALANPIELLAEWVLRPTPTTKGIPFLFKKRE